MNETNITIEIAQNPSELQPLVEIITHEAFDLTNRLVAGLLGPAMRYCGFVQNVRLPNGNIIGFNCVLFTGVPGEFFFDLIYICPEWRGRRIGQKLHQKAEVQCITMGAKRFIATAIPTNMAILRILLNVCGWRAFDFENDAYGYNEPRLFIEKVIERRNAFPSKYEQKSDILVPLEDTNAIKKALRDQAYYGTSVEECAGTNILRCKSRHQILSKEETIIERKDSITDDIVSEAFGLELLINLYGCNELKIRSRKKILKFVTQLISILGIRKFGDPIIERFGLRCEKTVGYTVVQLLEMSSIVGHFSEASNSVYLDIFSCKSFDIDIVTCFCRDFFNASEVENHVLERK